jgi:hypothetical protein
MTSVSEVPWIQGNSTIIGHCHVFVVSVGGSEWHTVHIKNSSVDSERESHVRVAAGSFNIEISICMWIKVNTKILVRFEVFTAVTMKNAAFWDVAPCRSCVNWCFGGTYRLHLQSLQLPAHIFLYPEDGGHRFLRNVGLHKIYMAPHPTRQNSSSIFL